MKAFAQERDAEKAARKLAEDRLAEEIASHAKTEEADAERARIEVSYSLEKKNAELQAALLELQTTTDSLNFEALQQSLVRLGIIDPDDQQYPQAFCIAPFLKSVCAAAKQNTTNSKEGLERKLATAAHEAFEVSDDGDDSSEPVSDEPPQGTIESTSSYPVVQERVYSP